MKPQTTSAVRLRSAKDGGGDPEAKHTMTRMLYVLDRFRLIRQTMPVHLVSALLRIACDEGRSVIHYARDSGVSQSVMSRHITELCDKSWNGGPGMGFVEKRTASASEREHEVYLTAKGRKFLRECVSFLQTGSLDGA